MAETTFDFQKDVIERSKTTPVVVDFWAEWCGPCRVLGPVLEKLADEANGTWQLIKINTEEHQQIAMDYRIQGIPAVKMFSNGEVAAEFVGALPEGQVRKWLENNIPTESKRILTEANRALSSGDRAAAQALFQDALAEDKDNWEAKISLAGLVFESEPEKVLDLVNDAPPEHPLYSHAESILNLSNLINSYELLEKRAQEDDQNSEAWTHYLRGIDAARDHNYEQALTNWIDTLLIDRNIDDDGPRRACVALFTWLGQDHELTGKYHRSFTSALF